MRCAKRRRPPSWAVAGARRMPEEVERRLSAAVAEMLREPEGRRAPSNGERGTDMARKRETALPEDVRDLPMLITTEQAAQIMGFDVTAVRRMCSKGTIKAVRLENQWRINRDALLATCGL